MLKCNKICHLKKNFIVTKLPMLFDLKYYTRMLKYIQIIFILHCKLLPIITDLKYQTRI